MTPGAKLIA